MPRRTDLHGRALDLEAQNTSRNLDSLYRLVSELAVAVLDVADRMDAFTPADPASGPTPSSNTDHRSTSSRLGRPMRNEVCVPTPDDDAAVIAAAFELLAGRPLPGLRITHTPDGRQRIRAVTSSGTVLTPLELLRNLVKHHQGRAERYKQFALHGVIPKPEDIDHIESMEP